MKTEDVNDSLYDQLWRAVYYGKISVNTARSLANDVPESVAKEIISKYSVKAEGRSNGSAKKPTF